MLHNLKLGDGALKDLGMNDDAVKPKSEIQDYISKHQFNIDEVPSNQTFLLYHEGTPIAGRGNLMSISGAAKSRKTVIVSSIIASMMNGNSVMGFSSKLKSTDNIIHMDTEQAYFHYWHTVKRTLDMAEQKRMPDHVSSIRTRDAGSSEYRIMIMKEMFAMYKPSIFILDGVTDLVDDINSNEESTQLANLLLQLSDQYNALICVVIHETKSTNKLRGSIGTTIENKVECALSVQLDEKNSIASHVTCKLSRNKAFQSFTIVQDGPNGEVRLADESETETLKKESTSKASKFVASQIDDSAHLKLIISLGNYAKSYNDRKKVEELIRNYSMSILGTSLKINESKEVLKYYMSRGWIINNTEGELLLPGLDEELPF